MLQKTLILYIFLTSISLNAQMMMWNDTDFEFISSNILRIYVDVENQLGYYVSPNPYGVYLYDENNYQYKLYNYSSSLNEKIYPGRKINGWLEFKVSPTAHSIYITTKDFSNSHFVTFGYNVTKEWDDYYDKLEKQNKAFSSIELGDSEYYSGNYNSAINYYLKALSIDKIYSSEIIGNKLAECYEFLGTNEFTQNNFIEAEQYYLNAKKHSNKPIYYNNLALKCREYLGTKLEQEAEDFLFSKQYVLAAQTFILAKEQYIYINNIQKANEINIKTANCYVLKGDVNYKKEFYNLALKDYEEAIKLFQIKGLKSKINRVKNDIEFESLQKKKSEFSFYGSIMLLNDKMKYFTTGPGGGIYYSYRPIQFISIGGSLAINSFNSDDPKSVLINEFNVRDTSDLSTNSESTRLLLGHFNLILDIGYLTGPINPYLAVQCGYAHKNIPSISYYSAYNNNSTSDIDEGMFNYAYGGGIRIGAKSLKLELGVILINYSGNSLLSKNSNFNLYLGFVTLF